MSNVLQVDFLGLLHINADGIVAIAAAVLIVIGVLVVLVAKKQLIPRLPKPQDDCGYDDVPDAVLAVEKERYDVAEQQGNAY